MGQFGWSEFAHSLAILNGNWNAVKGRFTEAHNIKRRLTSESSLFGKFVWNIYFAFQYKPIL